jgi:hypothetical protein
MMFEWIAFYITLRFNIFLTFPNPKGSLHDENVGNKIDKVMRCQPYQGSKP